MGVVKFTFLAALLAMFGDAAIAHAMLWGNDPYWTYWITDGLLMATVFGIGTALFGMGIGRGAILTAFHIFLLTTYYRVLSPIGLPGHGEWLDLERTWLTGLPVHFAIYYLGYLVAFRLWHQPRSTPIVQRTRSTVLAALVMAAVTTQEPDPRPQAPPVAAVACGACGNSSRCPVKWSMSLDKAHGCPGSSGRSVVVPLPADGNMAFAPQFPAVSFPIPQRGLRYYPLARIGPPIERAAWITEPLHIMYRFHVMPYEHGWVGREEHNRIHEILGDEPNEVLRSTMELARHLPGAIVVVHASDGRVVDKRSFPAPDGFSLYAA